MGNLWLEMAEQTQIPEVALERTENQAPSFRREEAIRPLLPFDGIYPIHHSSR